MTADLSGVLRGLVEFTWDSAAALESASSSHAAEFPGQSLRSVIDGTVDGATRWGNRSRTRWWYNGNTKTVVYENPVTNSYGDYGSVFPDYEAELSAARRHDRQPHMSELPPPIPEGLAAAAEDLEARLAEHLSYWEPQFHSIEVLLREWAQLANSCSTFGDDVEDYLHRLGARDILLDVMLVAEGPLRLWLVRTVDRIDDVFIHASDLDRNDLMWGGNVDGPCNWWHRRIPRSEALRHQVETIAPQMRAQRPSVPGP